MSAAEPTCLPCWNGGNLKRRTKTNQMSSAYAHVENQREPLEKDFLEPPSSASFLSLLSFSAFLLIHILSLSVFGLPTKYTERRK